MDLLAGVCGCRLLVTLVRERPHGTVPLAAEKKDRLSPSQLHTRVDGAPVICVYRRRFRAQRRERVLHREGGVDTSRSKFAVTRWGAAKRRSASASLRSARSLHIHSGYLPSTVSHRLPWRWTNPTTGTHCGGRADMVTLPSSPTAHTHTA